MGGGGGGGGGGRRGASLYGYTGYKVFFLSPRDLPPKAPNPLVTDRQSRTVDENIAEAQSIFGEPRVSK